MLESTCLWNARACVLSTRAATTKRVPWTKAMHVELRKHSKAKTPIVKISKQMKRTIAALPHLIQVKTEARINYIISK